VVNPRFIKLWNSNPDGWARLFLCRPDTGQGKRSALVYPVTHIVIYSECLRGQMQGTMAPA